MEKNPYETLGVNVSATQDEIRNAYRAFAKKLHPDLNPGNKQAEAKFKEINAAYELVGTPEARVKFDSGEINERAEAAGRRERGPYYHQTQQDQGRYSEAFEGMDDDFLSSLFGRRGETRGQDVRYQMEVEFKDAALGVEREITLGNGKRLKVKIPAAIESGAKLKFAGYGQPGMGKAAAGDAFVEIRVRPSLLFRRVGKDIELDAPISVSEAILGAEVKVPTIDGSVLLKIPAGVSSGARLRIKGKGVGNAEVGRGDQFVILQIVVSPEMDDEFKAATAAWAERQPFDPRATWIGSQKGGAQ